MRRAAAALITPLLILAGIGLAIVTAQPSCADATCVRLPLIRATGPTATSGPLPTIPPSHDDCERAGPAYVEGFQAWLTDYNLAPGAQALVCARLITDGQLSAGALVHVYARYPDRERHVDSDATSWDGKVAIPLLLAAVAPGQLIPIRVEATLEGRSYVATTYVVSQPIPPTLTPTVRPSLVVPTLSPTRTATPTATPSPTP